MKKLLYGMLLITGCMSLPEKITPVSPFNLEKYMGVWYEIARLDHRFERGLENVTATYTPGKNKTVIVENQGYLPQKQKWSYIKGKAKTARNSDEGLLKVSFFGPFYSYYNIFYINEEYTQALVSSSGTGYLWILARTPVIPEKDLQYLISVAAKEGFNTDNLLMVSHTSSVDTEK